MRSAKSDSSVPQALRARGRLCASFERRPDGRTQAASVEEAGGYRMRFPKVHARASPLAHQAGGPPCEGTLINTGGGMAGGDRLATKIEARPRAHVLRSPP